MKRSLLAGALLAALLLGACGTREPVTLTEMDCRTAAVAADFSITLLRNAAKPDKTTLLSPYSVLLALGMAANGAGGRTLEEMEYALGAKLDDLNAWLASCRAALTYVAALSVTIMQFLRLLLIVAGGNRRRD